MIKHMTNMNKLRSMLFVIIIIVTVLTIKISHRNYIFPPPIIKMK